MKPVGSRVESEAALARALSRHIGYTTGAYELSRIIAVLMFFKGKPSAYREEIVSGLKRQNDGAPEASDPSDAYLAQIANFTQSMRLIETVSSREAHLHRYAATELGRSLLGAKATGNGDFYRYFLTKVVLASDADSIVPLLIFACEPSASTIPRRFEEFQRKLRDERWHWLNEAFQEQTLLRRVANRVTWLRPRGKAGGYEIEVPTANTARHHATPRQGWLRELAMVEPDGHLSAFGNLVLRSHLKSSSYFWLGPPEAVQENLRIPLERRAEGPFEDTLNFGENFRPPNDAELSALIEDLSEVMRVGFDDARLVHAPQASLKLPIEYIAYRSYRDGIQYGWDQVLSLLFAEKKGSLDRYSAHKGPIGFYRVRQN